MALPQSLTKLWCPTLSSYYVHSAHRENCTLHIALIYSILFIKLHIAHLDSILWIKFPFNPQVMFNLCSIYTNKVQEDCMMFPWYPTRERYLGRPEPPILSIQHRAFILQLKFYIKSLKKFYADRNIFKEFFFGLNLVWFAEASDLGNTFFGGSRRPCRPSLVQPGLSNLS